ncbi:MAG: dihydrofolate reductase [Deltaproteobacteria bacterium]|nr:dihydrofolate reductase [Deltaproteobacteria bacterium]
MSERLRLGVIVAVASNGVIGKDGDLPWRLPEDLKHFRRTTLGHAIIMGRTTWESIGKPLAKRRNIVVTRQVDYVAPGAEVAHSLPEALAMARTTDPEPFVIGGASLYAEALGSATRLEITEVHREVAGDTWFPAFDRDRFTEVSRRPGDGVDFVTWVRDVD